jgi:hypothetical protein
LRGMPRRREVAADKRELVASRRLRPAEFSPTLCLVLTHSRAAKSEPAAVERGLLGVERV